LRTRPLVTRASFYDTENVSDAFRQIDTPTIDDLTPARPPKLSGVFFLAAQAIIGWIGATADCLPHFQRKMGNAIFMEEMGLRWQRTARAVTLRTRDRLQKRGSEPISH
jgi:hypothetical protein